MNLSSFACLGLHIPVWHRRQSGSASGTTDLHRDPKPPSPTTAMTHTHTDNDADEKTATAAHTGQTDALRPEGQARHGEEIVTEWREGPHLVIERQRSDLDVEVEVIRNAFPSDGVARFAGRRDKVMRDVHEHLQSIGHRVEDMFAGRPSSKSPATAPKQ